MNVKSEINNGILYIFVNNSLIKSLTPSFDEQNTFVNYFKYKGNRYDFILDRTKIMNKTNYKLYLFPLNEFKQNRIEVKVKNQ